MAWIENVNDIIRNGKTIPGRRRNSKTFIDDVNPAKFAIDSSIGSLHYHDGAAWQDCDCTIGASGISGFVDACDKASYAFHADGNGQRRIYPRRNITTEYITLARPQYWSGTAWANLTVGTRTRTGNTLTWDRPAFSMAITLDNDHVHKTIVLKNSNAAARVRWPISLTGLTWNNWQLVSTAGGIPVANVNKPIGWDANKTVVPISCDYVNGAVEFTANLTGLTYPITIDPTIDASVGASTRDAASDNSSNNLNATNVNMGPTPGSGVYDWVGFGFAVSGPASGDTINTGTNIQIRQEANSGYVNCGMDLYADDVDNSAVFAAGSTNISGRTLTTATVDWTATWGGYGSWNTSPEINTIIQEIINRAGWSSGNYISILGHATAQYFNIAFYDNGTTYAAILHIVYTAAGGGSAAPIIMRHFRARRI
jgi:hypothetical protein